MKCKNCINLIPVTEGNKKRSFCLRYNYFTRQTDNVCEEYSKDKDYCKPNKSVSELEQKIK